MREKHTNISMYSIFLKFVNSLVVAGMGGVGRVQLTKKSHVFEILQSMLLQSMSTGGVNKDHHSNQMEGSRNCSSRFPRQSLVTRNLNQFI